MLTQEEIDNLQKSCRMGTELDKKLSVLEKGFVDYRELANGKLDLINEKMNTIDIKATQCNNEMALLNKNLAYRDKEFHSMMYKLIFGASGLLGTAFISILILVLTKVLSH